MGVQGTLDGGRPVAASSPREPETWSDLIEWMTAVHGTMAELFRPSVGTLDAPDFRAPEEAEGV
jgi:hypothetical protein